MRIWVVFVQCCARLWDRWELSTWGGRCWARPGLWYISLSVWWMCCVKASYGSIPLHPHPPHQPCGDAAVHIIVIQGICLTFTYWSAAGTVTEDDGRLQQRGCGGIGILCRTVTSSAAFIKARHNEYNDMRIYEVLRSAHLTLAVCVCVITRGGGRNTSTLIVVGIKKWAFIQH